MPSKANTSRDGHALAGSGTVSNPRMASNNTRPILPLRFASSTVVNNFIQQPLKCFYLSAAQFFSFTAPYFPACAQAIGNAKLFVQRGSNQPWTTHIKLSKTSEN
jgi:hypothetical protein